MNRMPGTMHRTIAAIASAIALLALSGAMPADHAFRDGYRLAVPPYAFHFPRDHAAHPEFRTEWWYYTGHLESAGAEFGYQITFFRVALDTAWRANRSAWAPRELVIAHAAFTDAGARRFRFDERIARPALGMAGADSSRYPRTRSAFRAITPRIRNFGPSGGTTPVISSLQAMSSDTRSRSSGWPSIPRGGRIVPRGRRANS